MIILRIGNELVFSSDLVMDSLKERASQRGVGDEGFDEALLQFLFHLESCDEAVEIFDDFTVCPVCCAIAVDGLMVHKELVDLVQ
jgi:hypothetical protein